MAPRFEGTAGLPATVEVLLPNGTRVGIRHQGRQDELVALVRGVAGYPAGLVRRPMPRRRPEGGVAVYVRLMPDCDATMLQFVAVSCRIAPNATPWTR